MSFSPQTLRVVESVPVRIFFPNNNATYYCYFFFFFLILFNNSPRCKSESDGNSFMNLKMGFFIFEILSYDISDDFLHYPLRTWLSLVVDFFIIKFVVNQAIKEFLCICKFFFFWYQSGTGRELFIDY